MKSPVGALTLVASSTGLMAVLWENDNPTRVRLPKHDYIQQHPILLQTTHELTEYFEGVRQQFSVPLHFEGTPFQIAVWKALCTIPYGETRSYRDIAIQVGRAKAMRAVGAANGKNPISIIAPCHRVIGANGSLTGFAGGLDIKKKLLILEGYSIE
jgi:methylated-DNA-[protein]-cysteine S-methyltransferase